MNEALNLWLELREGSKLDADKHINSIQLALNKAKRELHVENANLISEISDLKRTIHVLKFYLHKSIRCPACGVDSLETHLDSCKLKNHLTYKTWRWKP